MSPSLSVCIVTYNQEDYIFKTIESMLNQKVNFDYEIIVGDDCSTDNTRKIVQSFVGKYPFIIKPIFHEKNVGPIENIKSVYKKARGKYICHLDGDDYALPNKLQKQFDNGEINKNQLSEEQIANLTALYKKQISNLKESNEKRIEKIRQRKDGADFLKSIKNIENEETKLLKLQKQYDNRLIETNDLSKDQIKELINLYKKQISELRKSNEIRKEKLLLYRKNMQSA